MLRSEALNATKSSFSMFSRGHDSDAEPECSWTQGQCGHQSFGAVQQASEPTLPSCLKAQSNLPT
jgi:hypothetical protein